jgi:Protein of unknown function (DUF2933)
MRRQHLPFYAIAAAILIVGLVALGVPFSRLSFLAVVLICPLMMMFMMRGMHGGKGHGGADQTEHPVKDQDRSSRIGRP